MKLRVFLFLILSSGAVHAGPRSSASYSVATDTPDAGGRRGASANYTNDGSIGAVAGLSTVAMKHGYIGQLYDVTGLVVTAPASGVNESATLQLAAWQFLDDGSFLAVNAVSVTWGVVSGPIGGISGAGLAAAGTVPQNSAATVQGTFGGFSSSLNLTIFDTIPDNFGSYAGDGVGDDWQVQFFGQPPNANAGPLLDPDGDGQNNAYEYTAGLIPTDANSVFRLRIEALPSQPNQKRLIFHPIVLTNGRTYTVKFRTDLATGTWTTFTGTTQSDAGNERTVTDLNATGTTKFYIVEINKP